MLAQIAPAVNAGTITIMAFVNEGELTHTHLLITRGVIFSSSVMAAESRIDQPIKILILCKITCYNWKCVNPTRTLSARS